MIILIINIVLLLSIIISIKDIIFANNLLEKIAVTRGSIQYLTRKILRMSTMNVLVFVILLVLVNGIGAFDKIEVNTDDVKNDDNYLMLSTYPNYNHIINRENNDIVNSSTVTDSIIDDITFDVTFDILTPSGLSLEELDNLLDGKEYMEGWEVYFYNAEQKYGINSLYLMSKIILESGWGQYRSGINNVGGWMSYSGDWMNFNSVEHCIDYIAFKLTTTYVETVGVEIKDVSKRYCPTPGYPEKIVEIMNRFV